MIYCNRVILLLSYEATFCVTEVNVFALIKPFTTLDPFRGVKAVKLKKIFILANIPYLTIWTS